MGNGAMPLLLIGGAVIMLVMAAVLVWYDGSRVALERRVAVVADAEVQVNTNAEPASRRNVGSFAMAGLRHLGESIRQRTKIFSEQEINGFERSMAAAGFNPKGLVPALLGAKMLLMVVAPVLAYFICDVSGQPPNNTILAVLAAAAVGVLGPNFLLNMARRPYLKALRKGLPDALDLMVICTEAGQGLETAVAQVAKEMAYSNSAIAVEFTMLSNELSMLPDRQQAILNLGTRSGADGLKRLAAILAQTMQFGTPLTQGLRAVAQELRRERMIALEARAARLPALLVLPMIFFIMPCLFVVLMGPSMLRLMDALSAY